MSDETSEIPHPCDLLMDMVASIVDCPEKVHIDEALSEEHQDTTLLTIQVAEEDVGKVLGKSGRTIRLIEAFMQIVYMVDHQRVYVDVGGKTRRRKSP